MAQDRAKTKIDGSYHYADTGIVPGKSENVVLLT